MAFLNWIGHNWLTFLLAGTASAGLLLTSISILFDAKARRVANLIQLTQQHRDLWERMYTEPGLERILDPGANLAKMAVTAGEEMFVIFIILHLSTIALR